MVQRKKVYVFGNPLVSTDSIPVRLIPKLQQSFSNLEFLEFDPTEDLPQEKELRIIDTVIGIDKVRVIEDIDRIVTGKVYSLHDFDLGFTLKLLKKAKKLHSVKIVGVPAQASEQTAFKEVSAAIRKHF